MKVGISYFGNRILDSVAIHLKEIKDLGCEYILHTYSESDIKFYSRTMKEIIALSQNMGFEVHVSAFGLGGVFGGEAFSRFLLDNPNAWQILCNGERISMACINQPAFRTFINKWIETVYDSGADLIAWDQPFTPTYEDKSKNFLWGCCCQFCQKKYKEIYDEKMPLELNENIQDFRRRNLIEFIDYITKSAKKLGLKNSICLAPEATMNMMLLDWKDIGSLKAIDMLNTDLFWYAFKHNFKEMAFVLVQRLKKAVKEFEDKKLQIYLQGFKIPAGRENEIVEAAKYVRLQGLDLMGIWSFRGAEYISMLRSDNPEQAWKDIKRAIYETARDLK